MPKPPRKLPETFWGKLFHRVVGRAKDPHDPHLVHQLSLVAFLAWVGLGVDGLSSSAYGPEEAFRALGTHTYLAVFLAIATALTVCLISYAYAKMIEHFPNGGGGYVVATSLLGKPAGVLAGSALLIDYVLTITVSIAGGGDAIFSLLPPQYLHYKLPTEYLAILILLILNLRGVKESIQFVMPFFLLFVVTHAITIFGGILTHTADFPALINENVERFNQGASEVGLWGLFLIFLRAYAFGGGTYTGIEAVSNSMGTLREPRVATAKRTMFYLSISLSLTAGGLLFCYMLFHVTPVEGKTLNAILIGKFSEGWNLWGFNIGYWFVAITMFSEAVLLMIAAQTGFIVGPKVMADMAVDAWLPRRFAALSDRLTMQNGIILMGLAAFITLFFTQGKIGILVIMYSINVFITFSLTQLSMIKYWLEHQDSSERWKKDLVIHVIGFILCFSILCVMIIEKFEHGAWATLLVTGGLISLCISIKGHYKKIGTRIKHIENRVKVAARTRQEVKKEQHHKPPPPFDASKPTAVILVGGYSRLGRRSLLAVLRFFPNTFHNIVFISVGVVNSEFFKRGDVEALEKRTEETLKGYIAIAHRLGFPAECAFRVGTDVVSEASELCVEISKKYPAAMFFAGELVFEKPTWFDKILHNETAYAIQRQIRFAGLPMVILPLVLHAEGEHEDDHE
jgi:amino acid transporter